MLLAGFVAAESWAQDRLLPRFASVRASEANMRTGPGTRYPIDWVLVRRGQPVEIVAEFETWRQVRDWQGDVGWIHRSMLRGTRTVIFTDNAHMLRRRAAADADPVAEIGHGVIAELLQCEAGWCRVETRGPGRHYKGWARVEAIWGAVHTDTNSVAARTVAPDPDPEPAD